MKKFWIKLLSNIQFFYSKEKRKIYRGKHNDATMYNANLRKRGISIGKCTYIADGVSVRDKRTVIGSFCSIARLQKSRWFDRDIAFIKQLPMGDIERCLQILENEDPGK